MEEYHYKKDGKLDILVNENKQHDLEVNSDSDDDQ